MAEYLMLMTELLLATAPRYVRGRKSMHGGQSSRSSMH